MLPPRQDHQRRGCLVNRRCFPWRVWCTNCDAVREPDIVPSGHADTALLDLPLGFDATSPLEVICRTNGWFVAPPRAEVALDWRSDSARAVEL
jgi:hypothetical protein